MNSNREKMIAAALNALQVTLDKIKSPIKFEDLWVLLKNHGATFDLANRNPIANIKAIMICIAFVNNCKQEDIRKLTHFLGEEDLNIQLLSNVETAIRKREKRENTPLPSLKNDIESALKIASQMKNKSTSLITNSLPYNPSASPSKSPTPSTPSSSASVDPKTPSTPISPDPKTPSTPMSPDPLPSTPESTSSPSLSSTKKY